METIQIEFQPNLKSKILDLLSTFSNDEVKISSVESEQFFDPNFVENKRILENAYKKLKSGEAKTYTIEQVDAILDKKFAQYDS